MPITDPLDILAAAIMPVTTRARIVGDPLGRDPGMMLSMIDDWPHAGPLDGSPAILLAYRPHRGHHRITLDDGTRIADQYPDALALSIPQARALMAALSNMIATTEQRRQARQTAAARQEAQEQARRHQTRSARTVE